MKHKLIIVLFVCLLSATMTLFASSCFGQAHIDIGAGAENIMTGTRDDNIPVMKISAGYQFGKIVAEGMIQPTLTRRPNVPSYFGAKAGVNISGFVPSIGYLYNYGGKDNASNINRWDACYALKYQSRLNDNSDLYLEGMYTKSSWQFTAGFHIVF